MGITVDKSYINDLAEKLASAVPGDITGLRADLEKNFRSVIAARLDRMDLVTREEFEIQSKVLARTREKLERLERELENLQRDSDSES
jgi:BMFP domain-containing protein YqiC